MKDGKSRYTALDSFDLESVVRGRYVYKRAWTPFVGQKLPIEIEKCNSNDARTVAVIEQLLCSHFQRRTFELQPDPRA